MIDDMKTLQDLPIADIENVPENAESNSESAGTSPTAQYQAQQQQDNWKELRLKAERAERAERERDEMVRRMQEFEQARMQQAAAQEEDDSGVAPDALLEGKHYHSMRKEIRELKREIKGFKQQTSQTLMENQLKAQYPDFYSVVSEDNLAELKRSHPAIAQTLATAASSDAYSAAASAYSIIKELGIARSTQESQQNRELIQRNAVKPRSVQSASPQRGDSPLSQANGFVVDGKASKEYQEQILKEMYSSMRSPRS